MAIYSQVASLMICTKQLTEVEEKLERQLNKLQHKGEARRASERLKDSF